MGSIFLGIFLKTASNTVRLTVLSLCFLDLRWPSLIGHDNICSNFLIGYYNFCTVSKDDYVYDLYAVKDEMDIPQEDASNPFPL